MSYTVHQTTVFVTHINIASPIASKFKIVGDLRYLHCGKGYAAHSRNGDVNFITFEAIYVSIVGITHHPVYTHYLD